MASSSSTYSNPRWLYDVFLSFRGKDTRSNFISHLHAALSNAGIDAFVDYKLHKGTYLGPELLGSIEKSHMSIIVFSKTYIEFIDNQTKTVSMIGAWGMGGSGKTTTAKAIYN